MNTITHICSFCKDKNHPVELSLVKREHKCACGVRYIYRPNAGTTYKRKPPKDDAND